jgi:hypothetical protein
MDSSEYEAGAWAWRPRDNDILACHLSGRTEKNHEETQPGQSLFWPRFKSGTFLISNQKRYRYDQIPMMIKQQKFSTRSTYTHKQGIVRHAENKTEANWSCSRARDEGIASTLD